MHLDSVSLELETVVFYSDCKMKRLKIRQRAGWERLFKVVQLWRRELFYDKILQYPQQLTQCLSEA